MRVAGDICEDEEPKRSHGGLRGAHEGDHKHIRGALYLRGHENGRRHEEHDGPPHDTEGHAFEYLGTANPEDNDEPDVEQGNCEVSQGKDAVGIGEQERPGDADGETVDRDAHGDTPKRQYGAGVFLKRLGGRGLACGLGVEALVAGMQRCGNGKAHQSEHDAGPCIAHDKHEALDKGGNDECQRYHTARLAGLHLAIGRAPGAIGIGDAVPTHDADDERVHGDANKTWHFQVKHHKGRHRQANGACHGCGGEHALRSLVALVKEH